MKKVIEEKKKNKLVGPFIIVLLLLLGSIGFILYDKGIILKQKEEPKTEKKEVKKEEKKEEKETLDFVTDLSKVSNKRGENTYVLDGSDGFDNFYQLDKDQKTVKCQISWDRMNEAINGQKSNTVGYKVEDIEITFEQKVNEMYFGGTGQSISGDLVLFLMEDGTVEYIPTYYAAKAKEIKSYGKIPELENIIKFYSAGVRAGQFGYHTVLAQDNTGKLYDLEPLIKEFNSTE
ncbi:MAG: hypothetical protein IJH13_01960 [Bacilli bacterium]|nr:hypothetical protein [Bacilli bacterium]